MLYREDDAPYRIKMNVYSSEVLYRLSGSSTTDFSSCSYSFVSSQPLLLVSSIFSFFIFFFHVPLCPHEQSLILLFHLQLVSSGIPSSSSQLYLKVFCFPLFYIISHFFNPYYSLHFSPYSHLERRRPTPPSPHHSPYIV